MLREEKRREEKRGKKEQGARLNHLKLSVMWEEGRNLAESMSLLT